MRRLLALIALIAVTGSATVGSAAGLRLRPTVLTAGTDVVAPCDADGITVAPRLAWQGRIVVDRIGVGGIADRCVGLRLTAVVTGRDGVVALSPVRIVATSRDDNQLLLNLPTGVSALSLVSVGIAIS